MRANRYFWFFISVFIGMVCGACYGWYFHASTPKEMPMSSLRSDYKTDYVLMVAEIFNNEKDITMAKSRLFIMDEKEGDLVGLVQQVYIVAADLNYSERDKMLLSNLAKGLESGIVLPKEPGNE